MNVRRKGGSGRLPPGRTLVWLLLAVLVSCGGPPDEPPAPPGPGEVAASMLEVTGQDVPPEDRLTVLFEPHRLVEGRSSLLEALAALPADPEPEIQVIERTGPGDTAFVDLVAALPGGGSARLAVRLSADESGGWKVTWFQGPDVEWPPRPTRRGESLTTSSHPGSGPAR